MSGSVQRESGSLQRKDKNVRCSHKGRGCFDMERKTEDKHALEQKNQNWEEKKRALESYMDELAGADILVAFSGGADSALLLAAACRAAKRRAAADGVTASRIFAATVATRLHPAQDEKVAAQVAAALGASHLVIRIDELSEAGIEDNPAERCYLCKKYLFGRLLEEAGRLGISTVLEGTNADDLQVYRPGIRAVRELGILSPLAQLGFTKEEVRALAAEYGLSVSNRPSSPCLATRFPYGTKLSYERMEAVDKGEQYLRSLGFYNVRLRVHQDVARIEVDAKDRGRLLEQADGILSYIKRLGFVYVTLDLEGFRSGSMDVGISKDVGISQ